MKNFYKLHREKILENCKKRNAEKRKNNNDNNLSQKDTKDTKYENNFTHKDYIKFKNKITHKIGEFKLIFD